MPDQSSNERRALAASIAALSARKASIERLVDRVAGRFVVVVTSLAVETAGVENARLDDDTPPQFGEGARELALLHEKFDPWTGKPLLCAHCDRVVPDMPFCPACGVAERASSRASRRQRRESPLNSNLTRNPGRSV